MYVFVQFKRILSMFVVRSKTENRFLTIYNSFILLVLFLFYLLMWCMAERVNDVKC
jgi:hypothetical protein